MVGKSKETGRCGRCPLASVVLIIAKSFNQSFHYRGRRWRSGIVNKSELKLADNQPYNNVRFHYNDGTFYYGASFDSTVHFICKLLFHYLFFCGRRYAVKFLK